MGCRLQYSNQFLVVCPYYFAISSPSKISLSSASSIVKPKKDSCVFSSSGVNWDSLLTGFPYFLKSIQFMINQLHELFAVTR